MNLRKGLMALATALTVSVFAFAGTALADTYSASSTSYAFMGGQFNNSESNYFISGPLEYDFTGTNMWGYSTIKFSDIGTEAVGRAYLNLELQGVGSMNYAPASGEFPAVVDVYSPGSTDVAGLDQAGAATLYADLAAAETGTTAFLTSVTMTSNGVWAIDITDIYNAWATGAIANNGLILTCASPNENEASGTIGAVGAVFTGLSGVGKSGSGLAGGTTAPYIETSAVPVPGTLLLLGTGLVGLVGFRRRS